MTLGSLEWSGSSPRARGSSGGEHLALGEVRFLSARAGPLASVCLAETRFWVHPRVRGAAAVVSSSSSGLTGSSPRARGQPEGPQLEAARVGFIPARAGPTGLAVRGRPGSSPRARGHLRRPVRFLWGCRFIPACPAPTGLTWDPNLPCVGFIPACAGATGYGDDDGSQVSDSSPFRGPFPRLAWSCVSPRRHPPGGSSPRARGCPIVWLMTGGLDSVHPRVRGVLGDCFHRSGLVGSSPRTRGPHRHGCHAPSSLGLSPPARGQRDDGRQGLGLCIHTNPGRLASVRVFSRRGQQPRRRARARAALP